MRYQEVDLPIHSSRSTLKPLLLLCCLALLLGAGGAVKAAPARTLTIQLPDDVPAEQVTIIPGIFANGLYVQSLYTEANVHTYTAKLPANTRSVKLLCYRPGYRMVTADFTAEQLASSTPFVPHFEKLPTTPVTFTFVTPEGAPLPNVKFVLFHSLETHQYFGYGDGMMFFADMNTNITDATGACTLDLPMMQDDPYFAAHPVALQLRLPDGGKRPDPTRDLSPESITLPLKTPAKVVVTVTARAKLHGHIDVAYIRAQHLEGDITPYSYTTKPTGPIRVELRAEMTNKPSISCMLLETGDYSVLLPPGTYELVLVEIGPNGNLLRKYGVTERGYGGETFRKRVPLQQTVTLRAGEDKTINVSAER